MVWDRIPFELGKRITYSKLGGTEAHSRDISHAFDILHDAMLVERIFPTAQIAPPLVQKAKSAPKALFLDVGLCATALHLTKDQVRAQLLDPFYQGALCEAFVAQELLAADVHSRHPFYFWTREEKGTSSELDFVLPLGNTLVPIEVKSGSHGSLKSLHQFLSRSGIPRGVRVQNSAIMKEDALSVTLPTGERLQYQLLSVPLYLTFRLEELLKAQGMTS